MFPLSGIALGTRVDFDTDTGVVQIERVAEHEWTVWRGAANGDPADLVVGTIRRHPNGPWQLRATDPTRSFPMMGTEDGVLHHALTLSL